MVHFYSAFIQGAIHRLRSTFTHLHTDGGGNHARHQPAHQEQLRVQSLARGLFDSNPPWGSPGFELGTFLEQVLKTVSLPLSHRRY